MVIYNSTNAMFTYEAGIKRGRLDQKKLDIKDIEEVAKRFHLDPMVVNRLILKIKQGDI